MFIERSCSVIDIKLTKSSSKTLKMIYKKYIKNKNFVFNTHNIENDFSNVDCEEFRNNLNELKSNGFVNLNILGNYSLTSKGIVYMEQNFKNKVNKVVDYIDKLKP